MSDDVSMTVAASLFPEAMVLFDVQVAPYLSPSDQLVFYLPDPEYVEDCPNYLIFGRLRMYVTRMVRPWGWIPEESRWTRQS